MVARDIFVEERELTKTHQHEWKEYFDFCPLVTVGDYVLTGWGATRSHRRDSASELRLAVRAFGRTCRAGGDLDRTGSTGKSLVGLLAPLAATLSLGAFVEACREQRHRPRSNCQHLGVIDRRVCLVHFFVWADGPCGGSGWWKLDSWHGERIWCVALEVDCCSCWQVESTRENEDQ